MKIRRTEPTILERAGEVIDRALEAVGLSGDRRHWQDLRQALEAGDESRIEKLRAQIGLTNKHVEAGRIAVRIIRERAAAVAAGEKATARMVEIDDELAELGRMSPGTVQQAQSLSQRLRELREERYQCWIAEQNGRSAANHWGAEVFLPELFGLERNRRGNQVCAAELANYLATQLQIDPYSGQSWLDYGRRTIPQKKRGRIRAADAA